MSMRHVVIDTNLAGAWSFAEIFSAEAGVVRAAVQDGDVVGVVPELFWAEFQQICLKKLQGPPPLPRSSVEHAYTDLVGLGLVDLPALQDLRKEALELCLDLGLGSYDAYFLALADALGLSVWTLDEAFSSRANADPGRPSRVLLIQGITALPPT